MGVQDFLAFARVIPDPLFLINDQGLILASNSATVELIDQSPENIVGRDLQDFLAPRSGKLQDKLRAWSRSGDVVSAALRFRGPNGTSVKTHCRGNIVQPKSEQQPAVLILRCVSQQNFAKNFAALNRTIEQLEKEVNERREVERALRESEHQVRLLLESTGEAIYGLDLHGRCTFANPACARALGYAQATELIGKKMHDLLHHTRVDGTRHPAEQCSIQEAHKIGADVHVSDDVFWRRDGSYFYVEYWAYPIKQDGNIIGTVVAFNDITERRNVERALAEYRDQLEDLVAQRTASLVASNRELEAFSYSIAHDLRAPLRSITSFSQILKMDAEDKLSQNERDCLDRVINAGKHMAHLIDDILNLGRITRSELSIKPVDLSRLCRQMINNLATAYPGNDLDVRIQGGLQAWGDKQLLSVLMQNLLGNALKFAGKSSDPCVQFGCETKGPELIYYVRDNGAGFDMRYVDKIFQPFQRLHDADEYPGTGVGLATAQRVVDRHGGRLWAHSEPGEGATFYFTLPGQHRDGVRTGTKHREQSAVT
jgi:PAS domain S-box-containing protein